MADAPTQPNSPILHVGDREETTVGNYFVSNYLPYSFWTPDDVYAVHDRLDARPGKETPFGLYVHIPFCRKRCDFCYFRVYTDQNSAAIRRYVSAVLEEAAAYSERPRIRGRRPRFVYFGGGTPSYLSVQQLEELFGGLRESFDWSDVEEVTFECEPGTLEEKKISALKDLGVTRLSLGVENFDAEILELNNRAHRAKEIHRTYGFARSVGFPQINIDLIAGMVGETEENWRSCIEKTVEMEPDSVTVYQLEVPYNTTIYRRMKDGRDAIAPVADWGTKRRWVSDIFAALETEGYTIGSAYTAKRTADTEFLYRDGLFSGADLLGLGVSSFSHLGGVHFQNEHHMEPYLETIDSGRLPVQRALVLTDEERLVREFILHLKYGEIDVGRFREKFGVDVRERFRDGFETHAGFFTVEDDRITLSREGLLQVDGLLHAFFLEKHRDARYA